MSLDKQTSLETMRTFARDVEREKGKSDEAKQALADLPATEETKEDREGHTAAPVSSGKHEPVIRVAPKKPEKKDEPKVNKEEKKKDKVVAKKSEGPTHIPAFHELQKKAKQTNIKAEPETPKEESKDKSDKKKKNKKPVITTGGTVITDNKEHKKPFFSELQKSISAWFAKIKKSLKPKKNTYTVTKTERRKGVVQKATSKTGTIFTADSDTLREQIKARQRAEKHEHDDEDLTWSPYTEPGYPLLEGEETDSNDPRVLKVSVTPKTHSVPKPKPVIKSTEKIPELQEEKDEPSLEELEALEAANKKAAAEAADKKAKEETPEPVPEEPAEETPPEPAPEVETQDSEGITDAEIDIEEEAEEDWELEEVDLKDTNTLAMLIVGVFLALGIFGFVLFGIFGAGSSGSETAIGEKPVATYQDASLSDIILFNLTFNEIVGRINTTLVNHPSDQTVEYQFVNARSHPLPGSVVLETIRTTAEDGFVDTVDMVRFVKTGDGSRALLLATGDATMTLGGMLNWEDSLYVDVGGILDIQNSIPPSAGEFVDTQVGNLDARALVFDSKTVLIYAIVNDTDVVITNDTGVLTPYSE